MKVQGRTLPTSHGDMKKYYDEINIARGIALLAVLIGHSFPDAFTGVNNPVAFWIHAGVYAFHMGLFFFLSGFVSGKSLCRNNVQIGSWIVKKIKRLMVPYLFYSVVTLGLKQCFSQYANNQFDMNEIWKIFVGKNPNGGMWYLWTLFVMSFFFLVLSRLGLKAGHYVLTGIFMLGLNYILPSGFVKEIFSHVLAYSCCYSLGIWVWQNFDKVKEALERKKGSIVAEVSAALFLLFLTVPDCPYIITWGFATISILTFSIKVSGNKESWIYRVLGELGYYSYDIYLVSYFVQVPIRVIFYNIISAPYWLVVGMMFVLGTIVPYYVSKYVLRKVSVCNKVMLGNWQKI
ncbi:acyltransferase [Acetatifactor muris]|uniref:Acyltransferase family protein n=1 Tax=Acetatifactor muris TaxID=879566 RepID=A0A2K4ZMB5_9FIRM|nr:acyltransferase [Acetatifactor muris]MCR2049846.1 acyltransferase [Acetatifactor muris]SOY31611.1 Acyltransferase family protein [Acetatifactor muris]